MGKYTIEDLLTWISNRHWGLHKHDTCSIKRERGRRVVRQPRSAWLNMAFALSRSWWGKADRGANIHETMGMRVIDIWCWKRTSTPRPLVLIPFPLSLDFTLRQIWEEHCSKDRRMIWKKWPGRIVWVLAAWVYCAYVSGSSTVFFHHSFKSLAISDSSICLVWPAAHSFGS